MTDVKAPTPATARIPWDLPLPLPRGVDEPAERAVAALMSAARLDDLSSRLGREQMGRLLRHYRTCLETDGDALLKAVETQTLTDLRRRAFLLEGAAMEMGSRRLATLCRTLKEDPESEAGSSAIRNLPGVLRDTLREACAMLDRYAAEPEAADS